MSVLRSRHCPLCGAALGPERIEGRERLRCPSCRFVLYENPSGASAGLVLDAEGRVLLVRRAIDPWKGDWALPAGYQEVDEEPPQTAEREVREESGLSVRAIELYDLMLVTGDVRKPANLAVYLCQPVGGELRPGDDAEDARWFALDALPDNIGFDNTRRILSRLGADERVQRFVARLRQEGPGAAPGSGAGEPGAGARRTGAEAPQEPAVVEATPPETAGSTAAAPRAPRMTYRDAGVDITKKYAAVERAREAIRASFTPGVVGDIGLFGGLFDLAREGCGEGLLVASADGVGTKLEVAKRAGVYHTVGRDLVQHCVNDILVQGARPLFFLDYVAVGQLDPVVTSELIRGCAEACRDGGFALLGGETAEMPGLYAPGDFDLAGFIVGVVEREKLLDGSRVRPGQVLVGLPSAGLHTNGYSLARKILFELLHLDLDDRPAELGGPTVGEALLAEHRSYHRLLWPLLEEGRIAAMAHITGGGLVDNLPRVLGRCDAVIDRSSWEAPPLFRFLCERGGVDPGEAYRAFNMGIGMVLAVEPGEKALVLSRLRSGGEAAVEIGRVEAGRGAVRFAP